jgi:acetyl esterase
MRFFAGQYLSRESDGDDWRVSPLKATSLQGLPRTVICTAEFDPLRDEGDAYASALRNAGVEVVHFRETGMIHGYFMLGAVSEAAESARLRACAAFRQMLI